MTTITTPIVSVNKISIITSRFDITKRQLDGFREFLSSFDKEKYSVILGGDDADYDIYLSLIGQGFKVRIYPHSGKNNGLDKYSGAEIITTSLPLRDRNKKMIDDCTTLIGIPQTFNEFEDSPAWKTIRYAISIDKEVFVVSPNGYCWGLE
jgi:hypothetical protein